MEKFIDPLLVPTTWVRVLRGTSAPASSFMVKETRTFSPGSTFPSRSPEPSARDVKAKLRPGKNEGLVSGWTWASTGESEVPEAGWQVVQPVSPVWAGIETPLAL